MSDWRGIYRTQNTYEATGAWAGLSGKTREDCPYDKATNPTGWNFWVYGCENARGEMEIIRRGTVDFYNAATGELAYSMPVAEAIATGRWTPNWASPKWVSGCASGVTGRASRHEQS